MGLRLAKRAGDRKMNSGECENGAWAIEVTNISKHGFWLLLEHKELFVPFNEFPWFAQAPVSAILNVERPHAGHLYWPDLDLDLAVESIEHPEHYPLVSRIRVQQARPL
jgi:Protein of unknown function (DUF2442)